jgi:hypothetical protein
VACGNNATKSQFPIVLGHSAILTKLFQRLTVDFAIVEKETHFEPTDSLMSPTCLVPEHMHMVNKAIQEHAVMNSLDE